jgi:hypothetical protein
MEEERESTQIWTAFYLSIVFAQCTETVGVRKQEYFLFMSSHTSEGKGRGSRITRNRVHTGAPRNQ